MKWVGRISLSWLLVWMLFICPVFAASTFPDVDAGAEYADAVEYVKNVGIMVGDENGNFNPNKSVTRAEIAAIMCNFLGETGNLTTSTQFTDVPVNHWANKYISRVAELGVVSGYGNGQFGPSDNVTYEQAVTMLVHAAYGSEESEVAGGYPNGFLIMAKTYGLLDGINAQVGTVFSRANVAKLLYNYYYSFMW